MSITYRKAREDERAAYLDFANLVFSAAHRPHDFQAMLPKVYGADKQTAHLQNIAVDESGRIRGLVAVMPGAMTVAGETLRTGYVGTVSVHPYHRSEGHMRRLMNMVCDEMADNGTDLSLLGGQRQRYEYFGFTKGGIARSHVIAPENVRHALGGVDVSDIELRRVNQDDTQLITQIKALFDSTPLHAARNEADFLTIARSWGSELTAVLRGGEFVGYFIGVMAGDKPDIAEMKLVDYALTGAVIKKLMDGIAGITLQTADFDTDLNRELARFAEYVDQQSAQQLKIYHFGKVIGAFMRLKASYRYVADGVRGFVIEGEQVTIRVENGKVSVSDEHIEDSRKLTAMEAQRMFFSADGWLTDGQLPPGWDDLPLYIDRADEF